MLRYVGMPALLGAYIVLFFFGIHASHIDSSLIDMRGWLGWPLAGITYAITHIPDADHVSWWRTFFAATGLLLGCQLLGAALLGLVAAPFMMLYWKKGAETLGSDNRLSFGTAWMFAVTYLCFPRKRET